jgi:hypothetical protein
VLFVAGAPRPETVNNFGSFDIRRVPRRIVASRLPEKRESKTRGSGKREIAQQQISDESAVDRLLPFSLPCLASRSID